jgi:type IV pilus assembly protein PilP
MLAACSNDMTDLHDFVAETRKKHQGRVDPLPDFVQYQTVAYAEQDLRDPFRPQTELSAAAPTSSASGPRPSDNRRREILESYPLDALKMVGILKQRASSWALVQDPEGTIHRVQPGNYAGQNHGKIVQISENQINLVELIPDGISGWIQREAQLALGEDE